MKRMLPLLLVMLSLPLLAMADTAVLTGTRLPEADAQRFLKNTMPVPWKAEYADRPILCFDVRQDGMIALGFNRENGKYAVVLDADGKYQYGLAFQCIGSFQLTWTDEGLGVIWVRSDVMGVFDEKGECLSLYEIETDSAFNRYSNALRQTSRKAGGYTFTLRSDHPLAQLSLNYGQLVRTDTQGNEVVLHDASGSSALSAVGVLGMIAFIAACMAAALRKKREHA